MPALLGYLIALAILLGGGYAGLEWLGSPDSTSAQHAKVTTPAADRHAEPRKPVPAADAMIKTENAAPGTSAATGRVSRDEAKTIDADAKKMKKETDAVPTGGCTPIGLTAGGQMVFPLQCREFLEAKRGPVISPVPQQTGATSAEEKEKPPAQPDRTDGDVAAASPDLSPANNSVPATEPAAAKTDAESNDSASTKTPAPEQPARVEPAQKAPGQVLSDDAPANAVKTGGVRRSSAEIKTHKPDRPKSMPDRSRLVKMTLLTIEFPDGHREQRLVPYRRFRNSLARDDD